VDERDEQRRGRFAVPGEESHESEETLSRDERGEEDEPLPPRSEPTQPAARTDE
jgi:hypothetical protein